MITGIDHVQVAAPPGCEQAAAALLRRRSAAAAGEARALAGRGGCWFRAGAHELHVGVGSRSRRPERRIPRCGRVRARLHELADRLTAAGHSLRWDEELDGVDRFFVRDPFGNRLELLARS